MDYYSDGTTLSKSGTKSATFLGIRISIIIHHSGRFYTVGIVPMGRPITSALPEKIRSTMRLQLY